MKFGMIKLTLIELGLWIVTLTEGVDTIVRILTALGAVAAFLFQYRRMKADQLHSKKIRELEQQIKEQELYRQMELNKQINKDDKTK